MALRPKPAASPVGRALDLGVEIAGCVVIGTLLGYWIDRWLGTEPAFLLVFMVFGFAAAVRVLFRFAQRSAAASDASASDDATDDHS